MPPPDTLTSEWDLIAALSREFGPAPAGVILGIGDDCAAIEIPGPDYLLWTVDTLVEGVHFDLAYTTLSQLGWKSLTVNLSDIAAMGGDPGPALLSLGWPPDRDRSLALEFAAGLAHAAREYGVAVIGGDTVASPGWPHRHRDPDRAGARPPDAAARRGKGRGPDLRHRAFGGSRGRS